VTVPFPLTDKPAAKKRPALVLSNTTFNRSGHTVLAMITTKGHRPWPGDSEIEDYSSAGLNLQCQVRLKMFTLLITALRLAEGGFNRGSILFSLPHILLSDLCLPR
jgi:hypothetical protein